MDTLDTEGLVTVLTLVALGLTAWLLGSAQQRAIKVVANLDLEKWAGTYYEVASTKFFFQKDLVASTITYTRALENMFDVRMSARVR